MALCLFKMFPFYHHNIFVIRVVLHAYQICEYAYYQLYSTYYKTTSSVVQFLVPTIHDRLPVTNLKFYRSTIINPGHNPQMNVNKKGNPLLYVISPFSATCE